MLEKLGLNLSYLFFRCIQVKNVCFVVQAVHTAYSLFEVVSFFAEIANLKIVVMGTVIFFALLLCSNNSEHGCTLYQKTPGHFFISLGSC